MKQHIMEILILLILALQFTAIVTKNWYKINVNIINVGKGKETFGLWSNCTTTVLGEYSCDTFLNKNRKKQEINSIKILSILSLILMLSMFIYYKKSPPSTTKEKYLLYLLISSIGCNIISLILWFTVIIPKIKPVPVTGIQVSSSNGYSIIMYISGFFISIILAGLILSKSTLLKLN
jgi:hypothetical protein